MSLDSAPSFTSEGGEHSFYDNQKLELLLKEQRYIEKLTDALVKCKQEYVLQDSDLTIERPAIFKTECKIEIIKNYLAGNFDVKEIKAGLVKYGEFPEWKEVAFNWVLRDIDAALHV